MARKNSLLGRNLGQTQALGRQCLTVPVGDVMNSGNNSHFKDNGTVTSNGSCSSSCHIRALQGITGCSVAQQSMDGRNRKQHDIPGHCGA